MTRSSLQTDTPKRARWGMYMELTKVRLSLLVLVTTAVGYLLGLPEGANWIDAGARFVWHLASGEFSQAGDVFSMVAGTIDWLTLIVLLVGAGLAAGGTSALNQWMEMDLDRAMDRTHDRPLPAQAMTRNEAFLAGLGMVAIGCGLMFFVVNPLAGFLTLLTATVYILIYTPLKTRSSLNTLVGAICGAIPPMIGWAAASEGLSIGAWVLGGLLFVWQLPHFLALAWMYRDDYAKGGFRMLPLADASGETTTRVIIITSLLLIPVSLMVVLSGVAGLVYALLALLGGVGFAIMGVRMYRQRSRDRARAVFLTSVFYLPLLMGAMVIDQRRPPLPPRVVDVQLARASE